METSGTCAQSEATTSNVKHTCYTHNVLTVDRSASRACLIETTCLGEPKIFLGLTPAGLSATGRPAAMRVAAFLLSVTVRACITPKPT